MQAQLALARQSLYVRFDPLVDSAATPGRDVFVFGSCMCMC